MDRRTALKLINQIIPSRLQRRVRKELTPSVRLRASRCEQKDLPLGASRLGGTPDLPVGFKWPTWRTRRIKNWRRGRPVFTEVAEWPLNFIAQINLRELAAFGVCPALPREGWLCFFYDRQAAPSGDSPEDRGGSRVFWFKGSAKQLRRRRRPGRDPHLKSSPCRLEFVPEACLPVNTLYLEFDESETGFVSLTRPEERRYQKLLGLVHGGDGPIHRMFGHAQEVQEKGLFGVMEPQCEMRSTGLEYADLADYGARKMRVFEKRIDEWRLLLQVDTDEADPGWMWGDCGRLYFWIRDDDLQKRRFDQTWTILQSY